MKCNKLEKFSLFKDIKYLNIGDSNKNIKNNNSCYMELNDKNI